MNGISQEGLVSKLTTVYSYLHPEWIEGGFYAAGAYLLMRTLNPEYVDFYVAGQMACGTLLLAEPWDRGTPATRCEHPTKKQRMVRAFVLTSSILGMYHVLSNAK